MDELEQLSKEQLIALHRAALAVNRPFRRFDEVVEAMKRETAVLFDEVEVHVQLFETAVLFNGSEIQEQLFDSYHYKRPLEPTEQPVLSVPLLARGTQVGVLSVVQERSLNKADKVMFDTWLGDLNKNFLAALELQAWKKVVTDISRVFARNKYAGLIVGEYSQLDKTSANLAEIKRIVEILNEVEQILLHVHDDFSHYFDVEKKSLDFRVREINISKLLKEVLNTWRIEPKCKSHHFLLDFSEDVLYCRGRESYIKQIVSKLIDNACEYTPDGSEIAISVVRKDKYVFIKISDNGFGMGPKKVSSLFTPFTTHSTTREGTNSGLGLTLAKGMIEMMGGEIGVESVEGEGSTFWFTLPLAEVGNL